MYEVTKMIKHKIAVIPGDGIGTEVIDEGVVRAFKYYGIEECVVVK